MQSVRFGRALRKLRRSNARHKQISVSLLLLFPSSLYFLTIALLCSVQSVHAYARAAVPKQNETPPRQCPPVTDEMTLSVLYSVSTPLSRSSIAAAALSGGLRSRPPPSKKCPLYYKSKAGLQKRGHPGKKGVVVGDDRYEKGRRPLNARSFVVLCCVVLLCVSGASTERGEARGEGQGQTEGYEKRGEGRQREWCTDRLIFPGRHPSLRC